jgi:hypothetical protein
MTKATADFVTKWIGDGSSQEDGFRPEFIDSDFVMTWTDVTSQQLADLPTSPNAFVCQVTAEESVLDALDKLPNTSEIPGTRRII